MSISIVQALILGIFASLSSMPGMGSSSLGNYTLGRPLVGGLVCGLVLGDVKTVIIGPCNDRPGAVKLGNNQSITKEEAEALEAIMQKGYEVEFALIKESAIGNWKKFRGQFGFN